MGETDTKMVQIAEGKVISFRGQAFGPGVVVVPKDFPDKWDISRGAANNDVASDAERAENAAANASADASNPESLRPSFTAREFLRTLHGYGVRITPTGAGGSVTIDDVVHALNADEPETGAAGAGGSSVTVATPGAAQATHGDAAPTMATGPASGSDQTAPPADLAPNAATKRAPAPAESVQPGSVAATGTVVTPPAATDAPTPADGSAR